MNFVRNKEIIDAEKCEYYVGKNKNLKSRQTQTNLGTPKRLMITKNFAETEDGRLENTKNVNIKLY